MVADERLLDNCAEDIAAGDVVANFVLARREVPFLLAVESGDVDTAGYVDAVRGLGNGLERSLDTIVNCLQETRVEPDGEGFSGSRGKVADLDASRAS